ncbi:MAG: crotonase/enoyl-CoA hydratase family protein [Actinobacteria bacterium]|nr:crotonase/enoyl-CoA hydratase family protein [Actinomycetota bacterium]
MDESNRVAAGLTTELSGQVLIVHLDDGKANALSTATLRALHEALDAAESNGSVRAVVLHGRPGRFSGGFDLAVMRGGDLAAIVGLVSDGGELVRRIYGCSLPVVAACTGHAIAAGALVLLGCDMRIGADIDCKIGLNEVAIGLVLPQWALTLAEARLSRRHAQLVVVDAQLSNGREAVAAGFLDSVVAEGDVLSAAVAAANGLATTLDPAAYAGTVAAYRGPTLERMAEQIAADRAAVQA